MASPEKALVDKVWTDKRFSPANLKDFDAYLFEDLRLDEQRLSSLDLDRLGASRRLRIEKDHHAGVVLGEAIG